MYVDFNALSSDSKVWVYTSNKPFNELQLEEINGSLMKFVENWKRHGEGLRASFEIKYGCFIVLGVDESYNEVSGCSIDASVNLIKTFEDQFNLELTNKLNLAFRVGNHINVVNYADFQKYVQANKILPETIVFNNMVTTKETYELNWEIPAIESWHKRFFHNIKQGQNN